MKKIRLFLFVLLALLQPAYATNSLKTNPSPYLALHGDDPVEWMPFTAEAMQQAKREDKLVFVSVGYFACHWCHVMQREAFSDEPIAALLNDSFISIKIDRELNPALDDRLMQFAQATSGRGGWPLNVFLTPQGYPLFAMTYAPPAEFERIVKQLKERWGEERTSLEQAARDVDRELSELGAEKNQLLDGVAPAQLLEAFKSAAIERADVLQGGFGQRAKFPSAPQLDVLLDLPMDDELADFMRTTLDTMATQGLRDIVGGGFFRYTIDPNWETPHYEKMLYTNALLSAVYFKAADRLKNPGYAAIALDTLIFSMREMKTDDDLFIGSLSAVDGDNEEGGFYLWQAQELKKILSKSELDFANVAWGTDRYEHADVDILPVWKMSPDEVRTAFALEQVAFDQKITAIRTKLIEHRKATRELPKDSKRLAGWNGLMLSALAASLSHDDQLKLQGQRLADSIREHFWDGKMLTNAVDAKGQSLGAGSLEDYAHVSAGLLDWALATGSSKDRAAALALIDAAWSRFYMGKKGWRKSETSLLPNPVYEQHLSDGPLPSPEAVLIRTTKKLNPKSANEKKLIQQAQTVATRATRGVSQSPYYYATLIREMQR